MGPKRKVKGTLTARNGRPAVRITKEDEKYGDPVKILDDKKSPLYKDEARIKEYLSHKVAKDRFGDVLSGVTANSCSNAIATFKDDGKQDRHDEEWLRQALTASARRENGEFDAYLTAKFEKEWAEEEGEESNEGDLRGMAEQVEAFEADTGKQFDVEEAQVQGLEHDSGEQKTARKDEKDAHHYQTSEHLREGPQSPKHSLKDSLDEDLDAQPMTEIATVQDSTDDVHDQRVADDIENQQKPPTRESASPRITNGLQTADAKQETSFVSPDKIESAITTMSHT